MNPEISTDAFRNQIFVSYLQGNLVSITLKTRLQMRVWNRKTQPNNVIRIFKPKSCIPDYKSKSQKAVYLIISLKMIVNFLKVDLSYLRRQDLLNNINPIAWEPSFFFCNVCCCYKYWWHLSCAVNIFSFISHLSCAVNSFRYVIT